MNKADLINVMATQAEITRAEAAKALDALLESIMGSLKNKDKVTLVNFGTFSVAERASRMGRNPRTNAPLKIPSKKIPKFKPGKAFIEECQG